MAAISEEVLSSVGSHDTKVVLWREIRRLEKVERACCGSSSAVLPRRKKRQLLGDVRTPTIAKRAAGMRHVWTARVFVPETDIYETGDALMVLMEMPGVERGNIDISVEDDVLRVQGRIDFSKYEEMDPVYTEYNVGNFARSFSLSREINQDKIDAEMKDGVLSLKLPKVEKAKPRTIRIT